jgi:LPS sulfotransferase NodH
VNADSAHSLTLVLSSARSGSSLLCRDLRSLGGLGFPKEYLTGLDRLVRKGSASEQDVLERLSRGCQEDAPGVAAAKVMVHQAGSAYHAINGRRAKLRDEVPGVVSWARERFDRVFLVVLVRNDLDQAISRVVAQATGIYHSTDRAFERVLSEPLAVDDLNERILVQLSNVVRNRGLLQSVLAEHSDIALPMTYAELTGDVDASTAKLVAHARAQGFEVQRDVVTRRLKKVISAERATVMREEFLEYLRSEPGF